MCWLTQPDFLYYSSISIRPTLVENWNLILNIKPYFTKKNYHRYRKLPIHFCTSGLPFHLVEIITTHGIIPNVTFPLCNDFSTYFQYQIITNGGGMTETLARRPTCLPLFRLTSHPQFKFYTDQVCIWESRK